MVSECYRTCAGASLTVALLHCCIKKCAECRDMPNCSTAQGRLIVPISSLSWNNLPAKVKNSQSTHLCQTPLCNFIGSIAVAGRTIKYLCNSAHCQKNVHFKRNVTLRYANIEYLATNSGAELDKMITKCFT